MRFGWILLAGVIGFTAVAEAGPQLQVKEATFDFGRVPQNRILKHDFWLKSVGDDTLRILRLWPGCGCTQMPLEDSTIAPGDSLPLQIIFNTGRFVGPVHKTPEVATNASAEKVKLNIHARVLTKDDPPQPLDIRPEMLDVSQFGEKTRRRARFHVENRTEHDMKLVVTDSTRKSFEIKLPGKVAAGETVEGLITVNEDSVESDFDESVTFRAFGPDESSYTLPIKRRYYGDKSK